MRCLIAGLTMSMAFTAHAVAPALPGTDAITVIAATDPWVDARLTDLDRYASRYRPAFDDELVRYQGASRDLIAELRAKGWTDSRIYAACVISRSAGRPCRLVANAWVGDDGQRWDTLAARFGVSVGSTALERLRISVRDTYRRLGRPIDD